MYYYDDKKPMRAPSKSFIYKTASGIELPMNLYFPEGYDGKTPLPTVLCIHGGGWIAKKDNSPFDFCWMRHHAIYFSERGYIGAEITYRSIDLDGINGKDLVTDASDAMRTLAALPEVDASKIGVIGDSAGGHLALCLALAEDETLHPAVVFACNPVTDCTAAPWRILGDTELRRDISPIENTIKTETKLYFFHGDCDHVVPIADSIETCRRAKEKGCNAAFEEIKGAGHAFILYGYKRTAEDINPLMDKITALFTEAVK